MGGDKLRDGTGLLRGRWSWGLVLVEQLIRMEWLLSALRRFQMETLMCELSESSGQNQPVLTTRRLYRAMKVVRAGRLTTARQSGGAGGDKEERWQTDLNGRSEWTKSTGSPRNSQRRSEIG